jgi:hypothetical protein
MTCTCDGTTLQAITPTDLRRRAKAYSTCFCPRPCRHVPPSPLHSLFKCLSTLRLQFPADPPPSPPPGPTQTPSLPGTQAFLRVSHPLPDGIGSLDHSPARHFSAFVASKRSSFRLLATSPRHRGCASISLMRILALTALCSCDIHLDNPRRRCSGIRIYTLQASNLFQKRQEGYGSQTCRACLDSLIHLSLLCLPFYFIVLS